MNNSPAPEGVELAGEISTVGNRLVISYRITNHRKEKIFLWDQMVNFRGDDEIIDPDIAYAFLEDRRTLRLVRAVLNLPPDRDVASKEIPYVREVPAGEAVTGRISLPIPVVEYSPFYPPPEKPREVECNTVRLLLGWSELREGMTFPPRTVDGKKVLAIRGKWEKPWQRLAEVSFEIPVKLRVHSEPFDRQMPMQ